MEENFQYLERNNSFRDGHITHMEDHLQQWASHIPQMEDQFQHLEEDISDMEEHFSGTEDNGHDLDKHFPEIEGGVQDAEGNVHEREKYFSVQTDPFGFLTIVLNHITDQYPFIA